MNWKNGTYKNEHLRVQVTNGHIHNPGQWVMHCRELGWNCVSISVPSTATQEEAQTEALDKIKANLQLMIDSIS